MMAVRWRRSSAGLQVCSKTVTAGVSSSVYREHKNIIHSADCLLGKRTDKTVGEMFTHHYI